MLKKSHRKLFCSCSWIRYLLRYQVTDLFYNKQISLYVPLPVAYPGGMHRMHVHPPCASPPPWPCASPPSPAWKAGYEKGWGSGQQEKNASLFTCDLIIFCCVSLYIRNSLLISRMEQADSRFSFLSLYLSIFSVHVVLNLSTNLSFS